MAAQDIFTLLPSEKHDGLVNAAGLSHQPGDPLCTQRQKSDQHRVKTYSWAKIMRAAAQTAKSGCDSIPLPQLPTSSPNHHTLQ